MNIYDAIFVRKSVRNYKMEELDARILNNLLNFTHYIIMLEEQYQVSFKIIENIDGKKTANLPVKAPYYLAIASEEKEGHLLNVGYIAEQISLYLTTKEVASCLMSVSRHKLEKLAIMEEPVAFLMAFGHSNENIYRDYRKARRISEEQLCTFKSEGSKDIKVLLKAGRLAPSRVNNQPWRFVVYDNRIHIFCRKDRFFSKMNFESDQIDIGIMLANLLLAAEELWLEVSVKKQDNIAEKNFKNNQYIISVLIK